MCPIDIISWLFIVRALVAECAMVVGCMLLSIYVCAREFMWAHVYSCVCVRVGVRVCALGVGCVLLSLLL